MAEWVGTSGVLESAGGVYGWVCSHPGHCSSWPICFRFLFLHHGKHKHTQWGCPAGEAAKGQRGDIIYQVTKLNWDFGEWMAEDWVIFVSLDLDPGTRPQISLQLMDEEISGSMNL